MKLLSFDDFVRANATGLLKGIVRNPSVCPVCNGQCTLNSKISPIDEPCKACLGYGVVLPYDLTHVCRECNGWEGETEIGSERNEPNESTTVLRLNKCNSCHGTVIHPISDVYFFNRYAAYCHYLVGQTSEFCCISGKKAAKHLGLSIESANNSQQFEVIVKLRGFCLSITPDSAEGLYSNH
ncbi:hypothetical protein [Reinekea sp. G2M2-21]|uniref:hypothetical protein n=1 Tax=Reinekea sp. G2M2-21 TaxID=2788942 RepID=UPI0018A8F45F|nr:hypothetical protein [Reinekea sp. G2M2-21]